MIDLRIILDCETNKQYLQYRELVGSKEADARIKWRTVPIVLGSKPNDIGDPVYATTTDLT
jgi:hypothetical protein